MASRSNAYTQNVYLQRQLRQKRETEQNVQKYLSVLKVNPNVVGQVLDLTTTQVQNGLEIVKKLESDRSE